MKRFYVIYLSLREDGNVLFSSFFSSFNDAKGNIDYFLKDYLDKRGKSFKIISKEDFEKVKLEKIPEDCIFVRRKNSEATLYYRSTVTGTFYNSYTIERFGKIGINEFSYSEETIKDKEQTFSANNKKIDGIEKLSHGVHVNLMSELKSILTKRVKKEENIDTKNSLIKEDKKEIVTSEFVHSLIQRKNTLRNITPPPPRKLILSETVLL